MNIENWLAFSPRYFSRVSAWKCTHRLVHYIWQNFKYALFFLFFKFFNFFNSALLIIVNAFQLFQDVKISFIMYDFCWNSIETTVWYNSRPFKRGSEGTKIDTMEVEKYKWNDAFTKINIWHTHSVHFAIKQRKTQVLFFNLKVALNIASKSSILKFVNQLEKNYYLCQLIWE